jgi:hypothetical protein
MIVEMFPGRFHWTWTALATLVIAAATIETIIAWAVRRRNRTRR